MTRRRSAAGPAAAGAPAAATPAPPGAGLPSAPPTSSAGAAASAATAARARATAAALSHSANVVADPTRWRWAPPAITLPSGGRLDRFDLAVDGAFGRLLRGSRTADRVFYLASAVGDHGLVWLVVAAVQAARRRDGTGRRRLLRAAAGLGIESAVVNGPVKWMFRRSRPVHEGPRALYLRQPRTSSFPSGHATAAFFAAALLRDDDPLWPAYYALAVVVAASRVHVRIHHASDVVGGVVLGTVLGEATRRLVPVDRVDDVRAPDGAAGSPGAGPGLSLA
ncbi:MAG TPA: phosphatase PAP2 family protein [Acidimicrobiales bacterium]|nr:phosphatase PAP2 family protein [Acidimicrobiales bacterium]